MRKIAARAELNTSNMTESDSDSDTTVIDSGYVTSQGLVSGRHSQLSIDPVAEAPFNEVEFFTNSHLRSIEDWKTLFAADLYECNPVATARFLTDLCRYPFRVVPISAGEAQVFPTDKPLSFCVYSRAKARTYVDLLRRKDGAAVTLLPLDQILYVLNNTYKDHLQSPFFFIDLVIKKAKYLLFALPYTNGNHLVFEANTTEYSPSTLFPSLPGSFFGYLSSVDALVLPKEMREGSYFPSTIQEVQPNYLSANMDALLWVPSPVPSPLPVLELDDEVNALLAQYCHS